MMEENKEMPNEETEATPEPTPVTQEPMDAVEEVAEEPVPQETELVEVDTVVYELTETVDEDQPPEEPVAEATDEEQTPTLEPEETPVATEEPPQEEEATPQDETTAPAPSDQVAEPESVPVEGETLVEMIEVVELESAEPEPADTEQIAEEVDVSEPPASDQESPVVDDSPTVESVIEAILFATDEPLPESKLAGIVETTGKQVRDCVENLNARYEAHGNAFRIEQIAGGYQMLTQPIYNSWLKKMVRARSDSKLSPAAMETLAIIAYKQPIIRADIEAIRGVAVGEVIRSLMYKGLVKIAGRAEILGRPMLYGTTKKFLEVFGLNSVKDLPKAEDLKNPDRG